MMKRAKTNSQRRGVVPLDVITSPIPCTCLKCGTGATIYHDGCACPKCTPDWAADFMKWKHNAWAAELRGKLHEKRG